MHKYRKTCCKFSSEISRSLNDNCAEFRSHQNMFDLYFAPFLLCQSEDHFYFILYFLYCLGHSWDSLFCFRPRLKAFPPNSLFWLLFCGWIAFALAPPLRTLKKKRLFHRPKNLWSAMSAMLEVNYWCIKPFTEPLKCEPHQSSLVWGAWTRLWRCRGLQTWWSQWSLLCHLWQDPRDKLSC